MSKLISENETLTEELEKIKKRYKQFRELLEQVECREKAEIVSENMKLKKVQGEMFREVHALKQENERLKTKLATMEKVRILYSLKQLTNFELFSLVKDFFFEINEKSRQTAENKQTFGVCK